jgi:HEAT repeat protein
LIPNGVVDLEPILKRLFAAELEARRVHDELVDEARTPDKRDALIAAARAAIAAARGDDSEEASVQLTCLARLLGEFEGADVADALVDVLDTPHPEARGEAGEQLQGLGFDRFKEVALAVERAIDRLPSGSPALVELPYVLVEIPEGGVMSLLGRFLEHEDGDAVAAAIEALVEIGDPSAIRVLEKLRSDRRRSTLGDDDGPGTDVTIGELSAEAIELLRGEG